MIGLSVLHGNRLNSPPVQLHLDLSTTRVNELKRFVDPLVLHHIIQRNVHVAQGFLHTRKINETASQYEDQRNNPPTANPILNRTAYSYFSQVTNSKLCQGSDGEYLSMHHVHAGTFAVDLDAQAIIGGGIFQLPRELPIPSWVSVLLDYLKGRKIYDQLRVHKNMATGRTEYIQEPFRDGREYSD